MPHRAHDVGLATLVINGVAHGFAVDSNVFVFGRKPDFDTVWAHIWENPNEFNGLTRSFRQIPRYMDC